MSARDNLLRAPSKPQTVAVARRRTGQRALVWDAKNTSSVLVARSLRARGWVVDWMGPPDSPWHASDAFNGQRHILQGFHDETLERVLWEHPLDALLLHGDDQVRWMLARWARLPPSVRRQLPEADALETSLSKDRSMQLAGSLGIPVLETVRCTSPDEAAEAARRLAPGGEVVLKGDGGSAGSAVCSLRAGQRPRAADWHRVTAKSPVILVQRRIAGPRQLVTVVYERGIERAACAHTKVAAWPYAFGPTAFAFTQHVEAVHDYTQRYFAALRWHGISNVEFRQDLLDGRWYFMECNPRVNCSLGIQSRAGVDIAAAWAAVCEGVGAAEAPGRAYRDGVQYCWVVPGMALALRRPWSMPAWGWRGLLESSDLEVLEPGLRGRAMRMALWIARRR